METIALVTTLGIGFVLGLYVSSQIMQHIDSRTRNKKFMKNLENFDKKNK